MKYHHTGLPTRTPHEGETYIEALDIFCTDHLSNPYGVQWMRYGDECPLPDIVQHVAHVAFEVEDLSEALKGEEVIIEPNSPSAGVRVAFIIVDGAPVELLEFQDVLDDNSQTV